MGCVARFLRGARAVALSDDLQQVRKPQGLAVLATGAVPVVEIDDGVAQIPARHAALGREITAHTVMSDRQARGLLDHASSAELLDTGIRTKIADKHHRVAVKLTGFDRVGNVAHLPRRTCSVEYRNKGGPVQCFESAIPDRL
jgi:hypothetical protein